jgi:hypothetical protein
MNKHQQQFSHFQQNREKHFAPKIFAALKLQYQQFLHVYKGDSHNALMAISSVPIHNVLKSLYQDSVHYGSLVYSQLPKAPKKIKRMAPIGFNQEMIDLINHYFAGDILNFSEGITDTTRELIKAILQQATEEGRGYDWIVEQLTSGSNDLTRNRSRLIARTETVTATNHAAYFAAAKTGLLMVKQWLSAGDNRVRLDHEIVNGNKIGFDDYFQVGTNRMLLPGARVQENGLPTDAGEVCNCRCNVLYIPQRDHRGRLMEFDYGDTALGVILPSLQM